MKKKTGFTLLELLIVMIIISIVSSIAVLTINFNQRSRYETLAKQLVNAITLAEQEALLRPATLGLLLTSREYQFYIFKPDKKTDEHHWIPLTLPSLGKHTLPANTQIILKIHDETVPYTGTPQVIMTPGNDLTPFVILIGKQHENPYYRVTGKANGEVISETISTE